MMELLTAAHHGSSLALTGERKDSLPQSRVSTPTMRVRTHIVNKIPIPPPHQHSGSLRGSFGGVQGGGGVIPSQT